MNIILKEGYKHIGIVEGVYGGCPILLGTRIEPEFIVNYGTIEEIIEDYNFLTYEQIKECYWFVYQANTF